MIFSNMMILTNKNIRLIIKVNLKNKNRKKMMDLAKILKIWAKILINKSKIMKNQVIIFIIISIFKKRIKANSNRMNKMKDKR
jgi:hypothetical protein